MKKTIAIACLGALMFNQYAFSQWECPSRIGGNLKPVTASFSNLTWATEATNSAGAVGDYGVANAMLFGALDYSTENTTLYLEGGLKTWIRTDFGGYQNDGYNYGLREAYFQYRKTASTINLGLRSTQGDDFYLLNERILGLDYKATKGNWTFRSIVGTVQDQFARNGTFCTLGYLYNVVPGRERAVIGRNPFETSLAMLSLSFRPGKKPEKTAQSEFSNADENSSDEFSSAEKTSESPVKLLNAGALLYTEFGSQIGQKNLFSGVYAEAGLFGVTFRPEILLQSAKGNNGIIWNLTAQKEILWSGQQTKVFGRIIGFAGIDSAAAPVNSFSNVFAGEVLRMDANELPLVQAGIKHSVPALKASLKLQMAMQTGTPRGYVYNTWQTPPVTSKMQEYDLVLSKNIGDHLLINAHAGYLVYPKMTEAFVYKKHQTPWGKIEMRLTF